MYPLLVACKSISTFRKAAAREVVDKVRQHSGVLVDQVTLDYYCKQIEKTEREKCDPDFFKKYGMGMLMHGKKNRLN